MNPKELIRRYEAELPRQGGVRIYGYVKPLANGEAVYEVHAAATARRKSSPLMTKCIYRMRTDKPDRYQIRDTIEYHSWSRMVHDHLIYDFKESGVTRRDYEKILPDYERGEWNRCKVEKRNARTGYANQMLPLPLTMLNGFDGTRYQYCGYSPTVCCLPFADYLHLYNITPKVELLAKAGLRLLLTEDICRFLNEHPRFGKWLAKHWREVKDNCWSPYRVKREFAKTDPLAAEEVRTAAREAKERRREAERLAAMREVARRKRENRKHDRAIHALYLRLKDICKTYGAYEVVVPENSSMMVDEGEAMHNCIGSIHTKYVAKGDEVCIFLRKDGKPCVDVAISLTTFKVKECRAVCNAEAPEAAWKIAEELAEAVRMRLAA